MLELNASKFFDTIMDVRGIKTAIMSSLAEGRPDEVLDDETRTILVENFRTLVAATGFIGAELASMAANRMLQNIETNDNLVKISDIVNAINDVANRLRDEASLISFMILNRTQYSLFNPANELLGWDIQKLFPYAAREVEEAAKCLALQRPTACVFHAMRMLEVGIRRFSKILGIPDPVKPAERNWGNILKTIKEKIDVEYPSSKRMPNSDGAAFEKMYASLDAVKNPWRNNTMHVEAFYTESEAQHILNCVGFFLQTLGAHIAPNDVDPKASSEINP